MAGVLVIEDDPGIRALLGEIIVAAGHSVAYESDGELAVDTVRRHRPDVVLLDIGLPGVHGFDVLRILQSDEHLRDIPVVMVSAWLSPPTVSRAFAMGAVDVLAKPFDLEHLQACISRALTGEPSPLLDAEAA